MRGSANHSVWRGCVAYWECNEGTGNLTDIAGGHTLTAVATPVSGAGFVGTAQVLNGTSQFFSIASGSAADFQPAGSFSLRIRVNPSASPTSKTLISKWVAVGNQRGYDLETNSTPNVFRLIVSSGGTDTTTVSTVGVTPVSGVWQDVFAGWDKESGRIWISADCLPPVFAAFTAGIFSNTGAFVVGALNAGIAQFFAGSVDTIGYWNRTLKWDELRFLHKVKSFGAR